MLFNSIPFAIFLLVVFILYWFLPLKRLKYQNILLLLASYFFYGFWHWRFLFLLMTISVANHFIGKGIVRSSEKGTKKLWLVLGLVLNIGVLSYFKYANFFVEEMFRLMSGLGISLQQPILRIVLPLGISFYTFLSISFLVEVYRRKLELPGDIVETLLTLSFFPIILAGPIQRPFSLLPQIQKERFFNQSQATDGLKQILWGLFMKVVIADRSAMFVNQIFQEMGKYHGGILLLGGVLFTVQVYADFAGYSLIAVGVARLFGFNLMQNFAYPYFARNISEFWKRWHISLTSWFRDYVYLPISYSISRKIPEERFLLIDTNIFIYIIGISITWLLTGLWHGANYTFIVWGFINGLFLVLYQVTKRTRKRFFKRVNVNPENILVIAIERILFLAITILSWIVFRAESAPEAFIYIAKIFTEFSLHQIIPFDQANFITTIALIFMFILIEWLGRNKIHPLELLNSRMPKLGRWAIYYMIVIAILFLSGKQQEFIYFQF